MDDGSVLLVRYDAACRAIAEAKTVDEAKEIRDQTVAMKAYARQAKNKDLLADCTVIQMRAEIRVGELMEAQRAAIGLNEGARAGKTRVIEKPALAAAGIDKNLAHRARTLARLPKAEQEKVIKEVGEAVRHAHHRVVRARVIEHEREPYSAAIGQGCTVDDLAALAASGYRAAVVYADPPWSFEAYSGKGKQRAADRYYDTQSLAEIKALGARIAALAAPDCALFLWAVMPELPGALEVIEAWGFEYKTCAFCWVKTNADGSPATGMGYWSRANAELCLLATRGAPQRLARDVHQIVMAPRSEHSAKPEEVRARIMRLVGGPYLELYGREPVPGWTVWGNQIPRSGFTRAAE
jgi:N6-adenosine-specific RNA methylase IME4